MKELLAFANSWNERKKNDEKGKERAISVGRKWERERKRKKERERKKETAIYSRKTATQKRIFPTLHFFCGNSFIRRHVAV